MQFFFGVLCLGGIVCAALPAYAGAWTQNKGSGQLIVTAGYTAAGNFYDNSGHRQSQPTYSKYELSPYFEYGLWDGVTAGASLSLQTAHQSGFYNWGLGDSEFFLRGRLWQDGGFSLSAEPMIKLPSPEPGQARPKLGGSRADAGLGLSAGYAFDAFGEHHFAELGAQYRHRLGAAKDQVKIAGTLGVGVTKRWTVLPQAFLTLRTTSPSAATFTQSSADDYDLLKLQLSAAYKLSDDISLQLGGFANVSGKNTGAGNGVLLSVWKNL